ncbi:hypothetical protein D0Z07_5041, partial [Hyphodiscus hymeniophilus]
MSLTVFVTAVRLLAVLLSTFTLIGAHFGLGSHGWQLSKSPCDAAFVHKTKRITQSLYLCYVAYATALTLVKLSLIASYLRIFPIRGFRRFLHATGILVVALWFVSVLGTVFECVPLVSAWDYTIPPQRCINLLAFYYSVGGVGIITDIVLWFAPLPIFWGMNMRARERIMVCGLFGFGFFTCIASILRFSQLHGLRTKDITYTSVPTLNWSIAEVSTAIICTC